MYNQPFFNTSIENYSNIIQDYQRDMNMFLSIVRQDSIRASLRPNVIPMPAPAPAPEPAPPQPQPSQTVQYIPPSANQNTLYDPSGASVNGALESVNMNYDSDTETESERGSGLGPSDSSTAHSFISSNYTARNARTPPISRTNTRTVSSGGGGGGWNGGFTATYVLTRQGRNRSTNTNPEPVQTQPLMEDVVVAPTQEQISNAVERIFIEHPDPNVRCPISLEEFGRNDNILRIRHCKHIFKEESLLNWFCRNVRCPVCRYDIRDYRRPRGSRDVSNNDIQRNRGGAGGGAVAPATSPAIGPAIPQRRQPPLNTTEVTLQELVNNIISDFTQDSAWNHFDLWNPPNAPGIITSYLNTQGNTHTNTTSPNAVDFIPSNRINLNHLINNMNVMQNNRSNNSHSLYSENMETLQSFDDTQEDVDSVS